MVLGIPTRIFKFDFFCLHLGMKNRSYVNFYELKIWRKKIQIWSVKTLKSDSVSPVIHPCVYVCCVYNGFSSNGHFGLKIFWGNLWWSFYEKSSDSKRKWYSEEGKISLLMQMQCCPSEICNRHFINGVIKAPAFHLHLLATNEHRL